VAVSVERPRAGVGIDLRELTKHLSPGRGSGGEASSCCAIEQRAYPIRVGLAASGAGACSMGGPRRRRPPRAVVLGHEDFQLLAERGDEGEAGGVVLRRASPAPRAARAPGQGLTLRTLVALHRICGFIGRQVNPGSVSELSRAMPEF